MIGSTLGPYKVLEKIGAGGMGEVYLAEDSRLNRNVAIKTLPEEFASDPERLARFEQEAKAAAALNHPHIAVVHDIGFQEGLGSDDVATNPDLEASAIPSSGVHYIVQEYLEGETLREPLNKGALPLNKALQYAREIAEALAAAHEAGIIHRDLKPDNVFITKDGHAKILDFGLAKLTELAKVGGEMSMSPTVLGTVAGQVMGTAGYMAPEQVEGDVEIDGRADIFAFGCLLYEMSIGQRAFSGKSVLDTLHAITRTDPQPIGEIKADAPAALERILRKCLAKEPADRYQQAPDLLVDLRALSKDVDAGTARTIADRAAEGGEEAVAHRSLMPVAAATFVAGAVLAALASGYLFTPAPTEPQPPMSFRVPLGEGMRATVLPAPMRFSPDGGVMVLSMVSMNDATRTLYLRDMTTGETRLLPGTQGGDWPFFSPDGRWVAFFQAGELQKVSVDGGPPLSVAGPLAGPPSGGVWPTDEEIVFAVANQGIFAVPASGGEPQLLASVDAAAGRLFMGNPSHIEGTRTVLFQHLSAEAAFGIAALSIDTGDIRNIYTPATQPRYLSTGHLAYVVADTLFVAPFDADELAFTDEPTPIGASDIFETEGVPHLAISANGTLAYFDRGTGVVETELVWRMLDGSVAPVTTPQRQGLFFFPSLSPDNSKAAYVLWEEGSTSRSIMVMDLERGMAQEIAKGYHGEWSHDGEQLYVTTDDLSDLDIYRVDADAGGEPQLIAGGPMLQIPRDISSDGEWMLIAQTPAAQGTEYDIMLLSLTEGGEPQPFLADPELNELNAVFSPDDRWVAWVSAVPGSPFEIYVTSFPNIGGRIQISEGGGDEPAWSADGKQLYFRNGQQAYVVDIDTANGFEHSRPRPMFRGGFVFGAQQSGAFDPAADGERLLMFTNAVGGSESTLLGEMNVIVNWFEAVRATSAGR